VHGAPICAPGPGGPERILTTRPVFPLQMMRCWTGVGVVVGVDVGVEDGVEVGVEVGVEEGVEEGVEVGVED